MRLKSQLIISVIIFGTVVLIVSGSIVITDGQLSEIQNQQQVANKISAGASGLAYISNDYFLYQQSDQVTLWHLQFSALSDGLSKLNPNGPEQEVLVSNVDSDLQRLNTVFDSAVSLIQNIPENETEQVHPELKTASSRLAVQNQALAFDSSVLSNSFRDQADQLKQTNSRLIFGLLAAFGAYFLTFYLVVFRRALGSIAKLQEGTKIIGSGNLDYSIAAKTSDEIGELSQAFNQMTTNLKTVTASKTELEQEIIERKRAEREIESIAKFPSEDPNPVFRIDKKGIILFSNESGTSLLNVWNTKVNERAPESIRKVVAEAFANNRKNEIEETYGEKIFLLLFAPIYLQNYANIYAIDITERKKAELDLKRRTKELEDTQRKLEENAVQLEEYSSQMEELAEQRASQLKDAERLATIGATAGMVGHDIRNPLQAITGDIFLAQTELTTLPESEQKTNLVENLQEIEKNVDYINKIVQDLQDYARPLNPHPEETDLTSIFEKFLAKNGLPENIKVDVKADEEVKKIRADSYFITRILYNLITNSVQAMPNGGKLSVNAYKEANDIIITVDDTGVGIPKDIQDKMFTPMFTTKSKGQGFWITSC